MEWLFKFLLSLGIFILLVTLMAVGVLFKRRPIRGSCGGLVPGVDSCEFCGATSIKECKESSLRDNIGPS